MTVTPPWVCALVSSLIGWYVLGSLPADTFLWPAAAVRAASPGEAPDAWLVTSAAAAVLQTLVVGGLVWALLPRMAERAIRFPAAALAAGLGAAVPFAATVYLARNLSPDTPFALISLAALAAGFGACALAVTVAAGGGDRRRGIY